jgi:hypothetical protein
MKCRNGRLIAFTVVGLGILAASLAAKSGHEDQSSNSTAASPIYGVRIPQGYRDWKVISVSHLQVGNVNELRVKLGNDIAIKAYREGKLPFPDGAIVAAIHWNYQPEESDDKLIAAAAGGASTQLGVAGSRGHIQFMVKNSNKYAASGGWGFADFDMDGKPDSLAHHQTCLPCHQPAKDHDLVYARYAPEDLRGWPEKQGWCRRRESNPRPAHYECAALPTELLRHRRYGKRDRSRLSALKSRDDDRLL